MPKIGRTQLICLLLASVTVGVFWQVTGFQFVDYDDPEYVVNNPIVKAGLTTGGIKWAFFTAYASNWHPLTWISHTLDCQLFGLNPGGHHFANLLLHTTNTVLLFWVLLTLVRSQWSAGSSSAASSGSPVVPWSRGPDIWKCAFVAALFSWHPLHVESVAWVSEKKDVLSTFFFILTIWAYAKYVERVGGRGSSEKSGSRSPKLEVEGNRGDAMSAEKASSVENRKPSSIFYTLSLLFFACGLMSKPMVVTLPFVILLLDFWPLRRFRLSTINHQPSTINHQPSTINHQPSTIPQPSTASWSIFQRSNTPILRSLVSEKLPFFLLSAFACIATVWAQRANAVSTLEAVPISSRVANATVSYVLYLWKMVWPHDLAVLYPYREWHLWQPMAAGLSLLAVSWWVVREAARRPHLAVGWFWYLGTLVPVIGFVQVGIQSMADRYTYVPLIGIFIMISWGAADVIASVAAEVTRLKFKRLVAGLGCASLAALALTTYGQLGFWQNSINLFQHTTEVTRNNLRAEYNLGVALNRAGRKEEAIAQFRKAVAITPTRLDTKARTQTLAHCGLGIIFADREEWQEAESEFRAALVEDPGSVEARTSLAGCLVQQGRFEEAIAECRAALAVNPTNVPGWRWLGVALASDGKSNEALKALREAVRLNPDGLAEINELAWHLAACADDNVRNGDEAVRLAHRACELTRWNEPRFIGTLDAAYAEAGNFEQAIAYARLTRELALVRGQAALASAAEERLRFYSEGQPYRQKLVRAGPR